MTAQQRYHEIIADQAAKAANAARRNKPTMWAYHLDMLGQLHAAFDGLSEGELITHARGVTSQAEIKCSLLPPTEAARLWALSIYARRILGPYTRRRVSLKWLHDRALNGTAAGVPA